MPVYWLCLIISTIVSAAGDLPSGEAVDAPFAVVACVAALLGWVGVNRLVSAYAALRVDDGHWSPAAAERFVDGWLPRLRWIWLPINALLLSAGQFAVLAADHQMLQHSLALRALWLLLPSAVAMVWSMHCGDELQRFLSRKHRWHGVPTGLKSLWTETGWILAPLFAVLLAMDAIGWISGVPSQDLSSGWFALLVVALPCLMPWLMSRVWGTAPVARFAGWQWLDQLRHASGVRGVRIHVWPTAGRLSTAAAIGFVPGARLVLITDGAMVRLPQSQLSMVALHELAHLKRWHMPLRLAALLPGWGLAAWLAYDIFPRSAHLPVAWQGPLALLVGLSLGLWLLRVVSHATELDADREACRLAERAAPQVSGIPATRREAAAQLAAALDSLTAGAPRARRRTWLHPSIADRLDALLRIA